MSRLPHPWQRPHARRGWACMGRSPLDELDDALVTDNQLLSFWPTVPPADGDLSAEQAAFDPHVHLEDLRVCAEDTVFHLAVPDDTPRPQCGIGADVAPLHHAVSADDRRPADLALQDLRARLHHHLAGDVTAVIDFPPDVGSIPWQHSVEHDAIRL